jgi:small subunit ribosomal protein S19e
VDAVTPPAWASIAKTGMHVEKQPQDPDWWYTRSASLMRKIYVQGSVGVEKLRAGYGGRKNFGVKPQHASKAGGSNVRKILQQLETAGYVETFKPHGRRLTREGRKLLRELTDEIGKDLVKNLPELAKYHKGE